MLADQRFTERRSGRLGMTDSVQQSLGAAAAWPFAPIAIVLTPSSQNATLPTPKVTPSSAAVLTSGAAPCVAGAHPSAVALAYLGRYRFDCSTHWPSGEANRISVKTELPGPFGLRFHHEHSLRY